MADRGLIDCVADRVADPSGGRSSGHTGGVVQDPAPRLIGAAHGSVEWAVLAGLPPEERQRVLTAGRRRRFAAGETIFHEGDPADTFHLVRSGLVAVRVTTPHGEQAVLTVLGPGQSFGELALLGEEGRRTATVSALEPCETVTLNRAEFHRLRDRNPGVDSVLLAALSGQVARLSEHLLEVLFVPAKARILRRLLSMAEVSDDGVVRLTQEDLARMSGTTRATVNEVLREAEKSGALRIGRRRIEIIDRRRLAQRSR